jgi:5'-nucleotidase
MRILLTNDDGIDAIGIRMLAEFASGLGEVTVVAPKVEQSGKSHAIDFVSEIEIKRVDFPFGIEAYSMDSTPADCVRFGILGLERKYDLVLSGINRGVNVGVDLVYSGTVGAIFEAARLNTAAIAFSAFFDGQAEAAEHFGKVFDFLTERGLLSDGRIFNVNIPKTVKGIRMTYQGSQYFSDAFVRKEGDIFIQRGEHIPDLCPNDLNRDTVAIHNDIISVTPLMRTRTDLEIYHRFAEGV